MNHIIEHSSLSRPSVYKYYKNKHEAVVDAFSREVMRLSRELSEVMAEYTQLEDKFVYGLMFAFQEVPLNTMIRMIFTDNKELSQYINESLRRSSEQQLKSTKRRYQTLLKTMRKAESSMQPVLATLNDNVLYLKHNLNASAVGALQNELSQVQKDVKTLITEMNIAIAQSEEFLTLLNKN